MYNTLIPMIINTFLSDLTIKMKVIDQCSIIYVKKLSDSNVVKLSNK